MAGLGVRELSLNPARAAHVRQTLRGISCREAEEFACQALDRGSPEEVRELLTGLTIQQQTFV
jgi:phosphoenolpyruvate-protein kinase (PTS system EI component)